MSILPSIRMVNGSGKPRLIVVKSAFYTSGVGTTFTSTTATEADGATNDIQSTIAGNPADVFLGTLTGIVEGQFVRVLGCACIADGIYNVLRKIIGIGLEVLLNTTSSGACGIAGTVQWTPALATRGILSGMRISSFVSSSTPAPTYAKVISVDDATGTITVDGWTNGTPTAGQVFTIDGFIADLPRCQEMTEIFDPTDQKARLVHELFRGRKVVTQFGWMYHCVMDYSTYIAADTILDMAQHLHVTDTERLILIPRVDKPQFQYNVYFHSAVNLSQFGMALGHKKAVFIFSAKELLPSWPLITGYGVGYGQNYGIQL